MPTKTDTSRETALRYDALMAEGGLENCLKALDAAREGKLGVEKMREAAKAVIRVQLKSGNIGFAESDAERFIGKQPHYISRYDAREVAIEVYKLNMAIGGAYSAAKDKTEMGACLAACDRAIEIARAFIGKDARKRAQEMKYLVQMTLKDYAGALYTVKEGKLGKEKMHDAALKQLEVELDKNTPIGVQKFMSHYGITNEDYDAALKAKLTKSLR